MEDHTFRPAGIAIAALVAGLAPAAAHAEIVNAAPARETDARETFARAAAKFEPAEPFAPAPMRAKKNADVPLGGQLDLPFRD